MNRPNKILKTPMGKQWSGGIIDGHALGACGRGHVGSSHASSARDLRSRLEHVLSEEGLLNVAGDRAMDKLSSTRLGTFQSPMTMSILANPTQGA